MLEDFKPLKSYRMEIDTMCVNPDRGFQEITLDHPAISVMIDHRIEQAPVIRPYNSLEKAMKKMSDSRSRVLMVVDERSMVEGVIASSDIASERVIKHIQASGGDRSEVQVKDIMTPRSELAVLHVQDVLEASVGEVLQTLNNLCSEHILVTMLDRNSPAVRGLFSATHIAHELKILFEPRPAARTFAELARALHGKP
jgi:Mg2+/Co2+ transporter CorC